MPSGRSQQRAGWLALGIAAGVVMGLALLAGGRALLAPDPLPAASPAPRFVDETTSSGLDHIYEGEFIFFVGGGVAAFDCNDDDLSDLFFAGGSNPSALFRNESALGGQLRFSRVTNPSNDLEMVTGAYPLDVDNDGLMDLAVLRIGGNVMLRGLGDCRFEDATSEWNVAAGDDWTVAFSAKWEGEAAFPTLAFGNYLDLTTDFKSTGNCASHYLQRPSLDQPVYDSAIELSPGWCTLSILFSDWDRSGRRDLRMTNDRHYYLDGEEQLWRVAPGELPRLYTQEDGWQRMQIWGMGIASQDLTEDGLPEVFLTSQGDNKLQTLTGDASRPNYRDMALESGATAHRPFTGGDVMPSTAWHAEFQDVNNDGYMDLFIAKGNVEAMEEFASADPSNLLIGQPDGNFLEGAADAGIVTFARARGAALVDLNLDGMLDLVTVNRRENVGVWRNVGAGNVSRPAPMGNFVALRLTQAGANRDAIGSWVEVRAGARSVEIESTIGGGHAGDQLGWIHVGLGSDTRAEVRVSWPDGTRGPWLEVEANQFVTIERGADRVEPRSTG
ncbi:MAG TPA: CRTAC1 family protein [Acidimicrobiia bacterium]